jgi:hypothetical protein
MSVVDSMSDSGEGRSPSEREVSRIWVSVGGVLHHLNPDIGAFQSGNHVSSS